jgi:hypothetical protein
MSSNLWSSMLSRISPMTLSPSGSTPGDSHSERQRERRAPFGRLDHLDRLHRHC